MPAVKNGPVDSVLIGLGALGLAVVLLIASRRRTPAGDGSAAAAAAIRRDMAKLVDDLRTAARDQVDRLDREVRRLKEAVAEAERARLALEETHSRARTAAPPAPRPEKPANPLHSRVFELRDSGKDPADIGVETGLEVGEVELILGLRRMPPRA
jgi:hypothetical protein